MYTEMLCAHNATLSGRTLDAGDYRNEWFDRTFLFAAADTLGGSRGKEDGPMQVFDTPRFGNWCQ